MNIIQIGCHVGDDHVYDFILNNYCNNIILIDANPYALEVCKRKYADIQTNIIYLNYAIVPQLDTSNHIKFYIPLDDKVSAHCSTSLDFIKKHNHTDWESIETPCITINQLILENLKLQVIDRLYIDAEGLDAKIISSLDLDKINIKYILFEHIHSDGAFIHGSELNKAIDKLKKYNFIIENSDMYNISFIKQ